MVVPGFNVVISLGLRRVNPLFKIFYSILILCKYNPYSLRPHDGQAGVWAHHHGLPVERVHLRRSKGRELWVASFMF
jgi:hypothetical protein